MTILPSELPASPVHHHSPQPPPISTHRSRPARQVLNILIIIISSKTDVSQNFSPLRPFLQHPPIQATPFPFRSSIRLTPPPTTRRYKRPPTTSTPEHTVLIETVANASPSSGCLLGLWWCLWGVDDGYSGLVAVWSAARCSVQLRLGLRISSPKIRCMGQPCLC